MALNAAQLISVGQYAGLQLFQQKELTANFNVSDLAAAATSIDSAFDTTLSNAAIVVGGTTTVINGLAAAIPAPFSGATAQQKTMMACWVMMKRAGLI